MQTTPARRAEIAAARPRARDEADAKIVAMNCATTILKTGDLVTLESVEVMIQAAKSPGQSRRQSIEIKGYRSNGVSPDLPTFFAVHQCSL